MLNRVCLYRGITVGELLEQFTSQGVGAYVYVKSNNNARCDDMSRIIDIDRDITIRPDKFYIGTIIICDLCESKEEGQLQN